jgi:hypothetical protein
MANLQLEAALAIQDRKKRLEAKKAAEKERRARERHKKSPAEKQRREERERKSADSMRLFIAYMDAQRCDANERPLYEVIIESVDIADPKFSVLRARIVVSVKLEIAKYEHLPGDEQQRRLARAREILTTLVEEVPREGGAP